jgi:uncharacterized membrane protein
MESSISLSIFIAVLYFGIRYIERKVKKEEMQVKVLMRDALLVSLCVFIGSNLYSNIMPLADGMVGGGSGVGMTGGNGGGGSSKSATGASGKSTYIFTDEPEF